MAIAFFIVGIALIISAFRNTQGTLGDLLAGDFTGTDSFLYWLILAAILGAIGYIPAARTPSRWFMGLLVVVVFLTQGSGFFSQLQSALSGARSQANTPIQNPATPTTGIPISIGGGAGNVIGTAANAATGISKIASFF